MVETGSLRVLDILANASATIAEGEVLQMTAATDLRTDESVYLQVVRGKTAALFSAATEVAGVIAGASEEQVKACSTMATRWASPSRSPTICWIIRATARPPARMSATISASAS